MANVKVVSLIGFLSVLALQGTPAQSAQDSYMTALSSYLEATDGVPASSVAGLTTLHATFVSTCPQGERCTSTPGVYLITYADGDGDGEAIMANGYNAPGVQCPTCLRVLIAGGGALDATDIESLGFSATIAQQLLSG